MKKENLENVRFEVVKIISERRIDGLRTYVIRTPNNSQFETHITFSSMTNVTKQILREESIKAYLEFLNSEKTKNDEIKLGDII